MENSGVGVEYDTIEVNERTSLAVRVYRPPPDQAAAKQELVMVLVHQYSVLGGCQALLKGMATALALRGFICISFDMRGAGRSTGKASWTGSSEVQDVVSACRWAATRIPTKKILLVGSSAGAPISGSAVDQVEEVVGYVGLGYPFGILASLLFGHHNKAILESTKPKLFVLGTKDGFTSVKQLQNKLKAAAGRVETRLVPGAGHFQMEGPQYDNQMADYIIEFANTL